MLRTFKEEVRSDRDRGIIQTEMRKVITNRKRRRKYGYDGTICIFKEVIFDAFI